MRWWTLLVLVPSALGFCPPGCSCSKDAAPTVDCDGAGLSTFPLFLNPRTRSLNLRNNELTGITSDDLEFYQELEFLDLSFNSLLTLDKAPFYKLGKLRVLNLRGNRLHSLHIDTFRGLDGLAILDLSANSIARIPTSVFVDLRQLELVNLSSNAIGDVSPGAFTGLNNLLELHLAANELRVLPKVALHAPTNLRVLDLGDNLLSAIPADGFEHLSRLETLDLSRNQLEQVAERGFAGLSSLQELELSSNAFTSVPTLSFRALTDLRRLRLGRNLLRDLPTSSFEGLAGLVELSVEDCSELSYVDLNAFSGLGSLETLRLNSNLNLQSIHPMAFERPTALRELHLADCGLSSLPSGLLSWGELKLVELSGNPWDCTCDLNWLGDVLNSVPVNAAPALCASPRHLQGQRVSSLSSSAGDCGSVGGLRREVVVTMGLVGGCLFLVTGLGVLLLACRHRLVSVCSTPTKAPLGIYSNSDCLSASDYDLGRDSKSLLYAYSTGSAHYPGRPPTLPDSRNYYATIGDTRTHQFRVIRNYPVPITEL